MRRGRSRRFVAPWGLLVTVPWVTLAGVTFAGCSCPTATREMKLTPEGLTALGSANEGKLSPEMCANFCEGQAPVDAQHRPAMHWTCTLIHDGPDKLVDCSGSYPCIGGRRPEGALAGDASEDGYLAALAALEGASVVAFLDLAEDLHAHGAPDFLVARAVRAAEEEVRHAHATARLAASYGRGPDSVVVENRSTPALEDLAIENAVEGGVREAYGALVAVHQAEHAGDASVRRAMTFIARDELSHARLAADVDRWTRSRLSRSSRARVEEASDVARAELVASADREMSEPQRRVLGWPSAELAVDLALDVARQV